MIIIEDTDRWCTSCMNKTGVKQIGVGTANVLQTFNLCKPCRAELFNALQEEKAEYRAAQSMNQSE